MACELAQFNVVDAMRTVRCTLIIALTSGKGMKASFRARGMTSLLTKLIDRAVLPSTRSMPSSEATT